MNLSLHLRPSLYLYSANKKQNGAEGSTLYINKGIYVTLVNELSAFAETFKELLNKSPKYCIL